MTICIKVLGESSLIEQKGSIEKELILFFS